MERTQSTLCRLRLPASTPVVRGTSGRKISHAELTLPGNNIGIDHGTAQFPEHRHHRALPRRDSTREPDQEHRALQGKEKRLNPRQDGAGPTVLSTSNRHLHPPLSFVRSEGVART